MKMYPDVVFFIVIALSKLVQGITTYESQIVNEEIDVEITGNCICVPYWQCKEDLSGLAEDGIDVMDIRVSNNQLQASSPCTGDFDVCCKIECGRKKIAKSMNLRNSYENFIMGFRIMGENNEADFGEFPWMLGVLESKIFRCGASLIHPQVALTGAHCVMRTGTYKVRAGEWNWENQDEPMSHQDRNVQKIILHPYFNPRTLQNDIALLILENPFRLAENVGIICLPPPKTNFDYSSCVAIGWGKDSYLKGTYQPILKKIPLPIVPNQFCVRSLRVAKMGPFFNLHHSFICAGGERNRDTCKGDGGSPLMCPLQDDPKKYQQVGIVAWGLTCGLVNTPGVYVNVPLFREWIDEQMVLHNFDVNIYTI